MKKIIALLFVVAIVFGIAACLGTATPQKQPVRHVNPNTNPEVTVTIPELFTLDPDVPNDKVTFGIEVKHPVPIENWTITILSNRQFLAAQAAAQGEGREGGGREGREGGGREAREGGGREGGGREGGGREGGGGRRSRAFYEENGRGTPTEWRWNGIGTSGELVQSATDYRFTLSVTDEFGNNTVVTGDDYIISTDVLVRKDGDIYRMIVPSIAFPGGSSNLTDARLTDAERNGNARVLRLIARALTRFEDYKVTVEGHANPTTPPNTPARAAEDREAISGDRARAVVNYLITSHEIAQARLTSVGMGGTRTVADYDDEDENWKNRRVEFILVR